MKPWSVLPEKFYCIVDYSVLHQQKLKIPDDFVEKYGGQLSNPVSLEVPEGIIWLVGVEWAGERLWLHDGWRRFMEDHSLGFGHFLYFKYKGNSQFLVQICDTTATEVHRTFTTNARSLNHSRGNPGLVKEEIGVCTDNPSFTVTLKAYNIKTSHILCIPAKFRNEHMSKTNTDIIELEDSDGRKWPVHCINNKGKIRWLSRGWLSFVNAKGLAEGDDCVFELIRGNEHKFKVSIFPAKNKNHFC